MATEVEKDMDTSSIDARRTSSYKKDKSAKWEDKSKARDEQSQRDAKETCGNCGKSRHPRVECPACDKECNKCRKKGHYGVVYRSQTSGANGGQEDPEQNNLKKAVSSLDGSPRGSLNKIMWLIVDLAQDLPTYLRSDAVG